MDRLFLDSMPFVSGPFVSGPYFRGDLDRMVGSMLGRKFPAQRIARSRSYEIPIVMWETDNDLYIEAEIPGLEMSEVELTVTGQEVTLRLSESEKEISGKFVRRERKAKKGVRVIALHVPVESEKTEAVLKNGVLTIRLPKASAAKPKSIKVVSA